MSWQVKWRRYTSTYCSARKDDRYKGTGEAVTPDQLYISDRVQRFMKRCKEKGVRWAIFSDKYGVWFPEVKHEWYEKAPGTVTVPEFCDLLRGFDERLSPYSKICFFHDDKESLDPLYVCLLERTRLAARVRKIGNIEEIE